MAITFTNCETCMAKNISLECFYLFVLLPRIANLVFNQLKDEKRLELLIIEIIRENVLLIKENCDRMEKTAMLFKIKLNCEML